MKRNILVLICVFVIVADVHANAKLGRSRRNSGNCGEPKSRVGYIINGKNFTRGDYPWIVALMDKIMRAEPSFICGGTLISPTYVLSAAHCINQKNSNKTLTPKDLLAFFGAHSLKNLYELNRVALSPKKIIVHEDWNPHTLEYDADMSLLEFERGSIHLNDFVQPICLRYTEDKQSVTEGIVTGWGKSSQVLFHEDEPKIIKVTIQGNDVCLPGEKDLAVLASLKTFCAGHKTISGVCHGDSGGGLSIKIDNIHYLKGIVSSGLLKNQACDISKNAVYTDVPKYWDWIENKIGIKFRNLVQIAVKKVYCTVKKVEDTRCCGQLYTCFFQKAIDNEAFELGHEVTTTFEQFHTSENKKVEFLPKRIGEKFPNLKRFWAESCGLTIVRDFYFQNMINLDHLNLCNNKITKIEAGSFDDLIKLHRLNLGNNIIETLDEKLFAAMVNLEHILLNDNRIQSLSSKTFKIPLGKLEWVILEKNTCIDDFYYLLANSDQMEEDLKEKCAPEDHDDTT